MHLPFFRKDMGCNPAVPYTKCKPPHIAVKDSPLQAYITYATKHQQNIKSQCLHSIYLTQCEKV